MKNLYKWLFIYFTNNTSSDSCLECLYSAKLSSDLITAIEKAII